MFSFKPPPEKTPLDEAIDKLHSEMSTHRGDTEEYAKMVKQLTKLYSLKEINPPKRVSPDTLLIVLTNLFGIFMIIRHEETNVMTSKAMNFVLKPK